MKKRTKNILLITAIIAAVWALCKNNKETPSLKDSLRM